MASDGNLKTWVSHMLMSLLGYSQATLVQYVIGLSKQATSPADVVSKLVEFGLSSSSETRAFAEEIFSRVPHKASGLNSHQKQEREVAMIARKTYALLDADDEDEDDNRGSGSGVVSVDSTAENKRGASHNQRFRKKDKTQNEDDGDNDEEIAWGKEERQVERRTYSEDDNGSESDKEMLRDQREREHLEKNLRERDAEATCKLMEPKLSKKKEEEAIRRSEAMGQDDIKTLRKVSRQEYLKKREQKKLEEIWDDIEDEQYLFDGVKLSEKEEREMRYKKEIFELVKKWTGEIDDTTEYWMPDAYDQEGGVNQEKRFSVVTQCYRASL